MRAFHLPLLTALVHLIPFSVTTPIIDPSLAGDTFSVETPNALIRRTAEATDPELQRGGGITCIDRRDPPGIRVGVPGTETYIILRVAGGITSTVVESLVATAVASIATRLRVQGDGLLRGGAFDYLGRNAAALHVVNANNHQTTYGVLVAALSAVQSWMQSNSWMSCRFDIYDGPNMVGQGVISPGGG
ncbi:MAG: hypothetical protein LQ347_003532 [Umbilicaria vellea]|nr:MAG: hypothetical protein LQ347_003532 [Umbilicaria vellea]